MKRKISIMLLAACMLTGCSDSGGQIAFTDPQKETSYVLSVSEAETPKEWFSQRDLSGAYAEDGAVCVQFRDGGAQIDGTGAVWEGNTLTIAKEGVYILSGTLENGQILIDADKEEKVQLVLDNLSAASDSSAAIYVRKADKVFVTLPMGTENQLTHTGDYQAVDDNNIDAVIFSKSDLTLNGSGSLIVCGDQGQGIVCKDDLVIAGGSYTVTTGDHAITGKDSLSISDGSFHILSGGDGLRSTNDQEEGKGTVYIRSGSFQVESAGDGIYAAGDMQIESGSFQLTCGGGTKEKTRSDAMGFRPGQQKEEETDTVSRKGIKADGEIWINDGTFDLSTADDGVHAGGNLTISGGKWTILTGDDGIHSDKTLHIQGGTFQIPDCYEGMEGMNVVIDGGSIEITAVDDGINAAGGADGSGFRGRMPGGSVDENVFILVNGGSITIQSDGDCLDSNGNLTLNGGTLQLTCGGYGNTALDCDGEFANNGAEVQTNDGSENGTGGHGFGGGRGQRGTWDEENMPPEGWQPGDRPERPRKDANGAKPDAVTEATPH